MILCDKLSEENIHCDIRLSNGEETVEIYWNGEDFVGEDNIKTNRLYNAFINDENIIENLKELFQKCTIECDDYRMELI
jgi:hypothetical protein